VQLLYDVGVEQEYQDTVSMAAAWSHGETNFGSVSTEIGTPHVSRDRDAGREFGTTRFAAVRRS
jgi:hypothetical protein